MNLSNKSTQFYLCIVVFQVFSCNRYSTRISCINVSVQNPLYGIPVLYLDAENMHVSFVAMLLIELL